MNWAQGIKLDKLENTKIVRGTTWFSERGFKFICRSTGVITDVTNVEQAQIAEDAGAVAVMVLINHPMT